MLYSKKYPLFIVLAVMLLNSGWSCLNTAPEFTGEDHKFKIVRQFIASTLQPEPGQDNSQNPLKVAFLAYPEAIWLIANEPETLIKDPILKILLENITLDASKLVGVGVDNIKSALNGMSDSFFQESNAYFEEAVKTFNFDNLTALQQLSSIKIPSLGKEWTNFLQNILLGYFPALELADKKRVFAALLLNTLPDSSNADILLSLVYAAGPFFQKYMQLLGDKLQTDGDPQLSLLKKGLMNVKSGLPSIHPFYLRRYLQEIKTAGNSDLEIKKSLGAASVGETFLADLGSGEEKKTIVIKLMRPGVEEIAHREAKFFQKVADNISVTMGKSFEALKAQIIEEMDYGIELKRLEQGFQAYNESDTVVRAVGPIDGFKNSKHWLAMTLAPGKTFKDFSALDSASLDQDLLYQSKANLVIKGLLLQLLTDRYIKKALFVSPKGFFHGDLHEGNIMMYVSPKVYTLLREKYKLSVATNNLNVLHYIAAIKNIMEIREDDRPLIQLTLIDFSNAHSLLKRKREGMLNLFIATSDISNSPLAFLEALNLLMDSTLVNPSSDLPLLTALKKKAFYFASSYGTLTRLSNAIDVLMNHNLPLPASVIAFSRSLAMIDNSYDQLNSDLGFGQFNFSRTIEKTIICPMVTRLLYFPAYLTQAIIKYYELGDYTSCSQNSDITLSWPNQKAIIYNFVKNEKA